MHRTAKLRLTAILILSFVIAGLSQTNSQQVEWKEYVYPEHGFAVTLPNDPHPHKSSQMPDGTTYSVSLPGGARLSLHTMKASDNCVQVAIDSQASAYKRRTSNSVAAESNGFKAISFREANGSGYRGIEFVQQVPNGQMDYERWMCAPNRLYVFTSAWNSSEQQPHEIERIVKSFRLLTKE
jgi:hypothetical protein